MGLKGGEVERWSLLGDKLGEEKGGGGGEQDAVAEVAVGEQVAGLGAGGAEERQAVGGGGAEAGPGLEELGAGKDGEETRGAGVEGEDVESVDGCVEAGVFDGGAEDEAAGVGAVGAGDDVDGILTADAEDC